MLAVSNTWQRKHDSNARSRDPTCLEARRPRAGFPAAAMSLQQTLDGLTRAGLSAAVVVQTGPQAQLRGQRERGDDAMGNYLQEYVSACNCGGIYFLDTSERHELP